MKRLFKYLKELFAIHNVRESSLDWWGKLTLEEQLNIESDYFDDSCTGETTDIDIEAMYCTIVKYV